MILNPAVQPGRPGGAISWGHPAPQVEFPTACGEKEFLISIADTLLLAAGSFIQKRSSLATAARIRKILLWTNIGQGQVAAHTHSLGVRLIHGKRRQGRHQQLSPKCGPRLHVHWPGSFAGFASIHQGIFHPPLIVSLGIPSPVRRDNFIPGPSWRSRPMAAIGAGILAGRNAPAAFAILPTDSLGGRDRRPPGRRDSPKRKAELFLRKYYRGV